MATGKNAQLNQTIRTALQMVLQNKMQDKEMSGRMQYLDAAQQGQMGLEGYRTQNDLNIEGVKHGNKVEEARQAFIDKVSEYPEAKYYRTMGQRELASGGDPDPWAKAYTSFVQGTAAAMAKVGRGEEVNDEDASYILGWEDQLHNTFLTQIGANQRQTQEIKEVKVPEIKNTAFKNQTDRMAETRAQGGVKVEERKGQGKVLEDIDKLLADQGVEASGKLINTESLFGGRGKTLDPLKPETAGDVRQLIAQMRLKLTTGDLTPAEMNIIPTLSNFARLRTQGAPTGFSTNRPLPQGPIFGEGGEAPKTTPVAPLPATPATPLEGAPDESGYVVGATMTIPTGPRAGTWQYAGKGTWNRIR
jgi:hypothetical protein